MKNILKLMSVAFLASITQFAYSAPITDTYTTGDTLTATTLNNIKSAVNDNDSRVTSNAADIADNTANITSNADAITNGINVRLNALESANSATRKTVAIDCTADPAALSSTAFADNTTYEITGACNGPIQVNADRVWLVGQEALAASSIVLPADATSPENGAVNVAGGFDVRIENLSIDASAWTGAGAEGSNATVLIIRSAYARLKDSRIIGGVYGVNPSGAARLIMEGANEITGFVNAGLTVGDHSTLDAYGQVDVSTVNNAASAFASGAYTSGIETYRQGVVVFRGGLTVSVPADIPGSDYYPQSINVSGQSSVKVRNSGTVNIQGRAEAYEQSVLSIQGGTFNGGLAAFAQSRVDIDINSGTLSESHTFSVQAHDGSLLSLTGGTIDGQIFAHHNSILLMDSISLTNGEINLYRSSMINVSSSTLDFSVSNAAIHGFFGSHIELGNTTVTAGTATINLSQFSTLQLADTTDLGGIGINCGGASFGWHVQNEGALNLGDTSSCP
jgi:hypothetical protein